MASVRQHFKVAKSGSDARDAVKSAVHVLGDGMSANEAQRVVKAFDWDMKYGPVAGLTRLQRWKRAEEFGMAPPNDVLRAIAVLGADEEIVLV